MSGAFMWQWEHYAPRPDDLMTRARAARLIRAWRKASKQGRRTFGLSFERINGHRVYRVEHLQYGERGALWIKESGK